ncbi:MAG: alginate export family protein [Flavobacteriales bacterium]|nr:alginate export family protein [Flavobacteriales bacterium]
MKKPILTALMLFGATYMYAQFSMDGELRPRTEMRTGTKNSLSNADDESVISTTQRTRLNMNYKTDVYSMKVSLQDVRTWGSKSTMDKGSENFLDLHEAWAEVNLMNNISLKGGRQEVNLDDQRIMGAVGWAQQARSHDMGLLKYNGSFTAHLGFAFNQDNTVGGSYETMNYLWMHKDFNMFKVSALRLRKDDLVTLGGRISGEVNSVKVNLNYYTQEIDGGDLGASLVGIDGGYKISDKVNLGFGYEIQSGKDAENLAFNPVFGTNHKFNGHMDYFYVGNHGNSVGLDDKFFSIGYKMDKLKFKMTYHIFNAVSEIQNENGDIFDGDLGTEIDLALIYPFAEGVTFSLIHAIYSPTESMQELRGGDLDGTNSYSYFEVSIKPKFLN